MKPRNSAPSIIWERYGRRKCRLSLASITALNCGWNLIEIGQELATLRSTSLLKELLKFTVKIVSPRNWPTDQHTNDYVGKYH